MKPSETESCLTVERPGSGKFASLTIFCKVSKPPRRSASVPYISHAQLPNFLVTTVSGIPSYWCYVNSPLTHTLLIIRTFQRWLTMLRTNFFTRYFTMLVMFYQCFCLSVVTNLLNLFVHVGTTGRYHNESLDSLTIILLFGSFLKIIINILFTHHCIHASCHVH